MKKSLEIGVKFDTSDFDKSVERMQSRLKDLYRPSDLINAQTATAGRLSQAGFGSSAGQGSPQQQQQTQMQARREMDTFIREQVQGQEKLSKVMAQRSDKLENLKKQQRELVSGSEDELKVKEKISRVEENLNRQRELARQRNQVLNQSLNARDQMNNGGTPNISDYGDPKQLSGAQWPTGANKGAGVMASLGAMLPAIIATVKTVQSVDQIVGNSLRREVDTSSMSGSAMRGTVGRELQGARTNQSAFDLAYLPEKGQAAADATQSMKWSKARDVVKAIGNIVLDTVVGAASGAATGAVTAGAAGLIGGPLAALTATGGGILGGVSGGIAGFSHAMSNKDTYNTMMPTEGAARYKDAQRAQEWADNFNTSYEGHKEQNPLKKMASDYYRENYSGNLQAQRGLGFSDSQLTGPNGQLMQGANNGFTDQMTMQMSQSVLAAGGSTRMARDSSFGNQLARGHDLTNAGSILGSLSGGIGSSEGTKSATIKILAEGMKLGLDDSKFAEENRKFTATVAEIVGNSGAKGDSDFQRISGGFGNFMADNSNKGIEGAKSAYQQYQQTSSTTSGPKGVMRMASIMADSDLKKMSVPTQQALMKVPDNELTEDNTLVQAAADEAGISAKEVIAKMGKGTQNAMSRYKPHDDARDRIRSYMKTNKMERLDKNTLKSLPADLQKDFRKMATFETAEGGNLGAFGNDSRTMGNINGGAGDESLNGTMQGLREKAQLDKNESKTGRAGDETNASMAENTKLMLDAFNQYADQIEPSAKAMAEFNAQLKQVVETIGGLKNQGDKDAAFAKIAERLYGTSANSSTQTQTGKKSQ